MDENHVIALFLFAVSIAVVYMLCKKKRVDAKKSSHELQNNSQFCALFLDTIESDMANFEYHLRHETVPVRLKEKYAFLKSILSEAIKGESFDTLSTVGCKLLVYELLHRASKHAAADITFMEIENAPQLDSVSFMAQELEKMHDHAEFEVLATLFMSCVSEYKRTGQFPDSRVDTIKDIITRNKQNIYQKIDERSASHIRSHDYSFCCALSPLPAGNCALGN